VRDRLLRGQASSGVSAGDGLALVASWSPPRMPVGGREVARLGIPPGPDTGRILTAFEEEWIAADFPDAGHDERLRRLARQPI
jgi:poly(A) polymerase